MEKTLLQPLVKEGLSQREIASKTGKSQTTVKYWLNKHGFKTDRSVPRIVEAQQCLNCGSEICDLKHSSRRYCNNKCQGEHYRSLRVEEGVAGVRCLKNYLLDTRGHRCEICGTEEWCGQPVPLVMDHVNGNSDNNELKNLRLVCGNCDMQLPTYKSKNRGNGRHKRKQRYREGKSY